MPDYPSYELPVRSVSPRIIREEFNSGQFWERARQGEFRQYVTDDHHYLRREARKRNYEYCTRSQAVRYFNEAGELVAIVHQVRMRNGLLGASGKPDPKLLVIENEVLVVDSNYNGIAHGGDERENKEADTVMQVGIAGHGRCR